MVTSHGDSEGDRHATVTPLVTLSVDATAAALLAEAQSPAPLKPIAPFLSPWSTPQASAGTRVIIQSYERKPFASAA